MSAGSKDTQLLEKRSTIVTDDHLDDRVIVCIVDGATAAALSFDEDNSVPQLLMSRDTPLSISC